MASVPSEQHARLAQLADAKGMSVSLLLAGLVERELAKYPENPGAMVGKTRDVLVPKEKYTVRLMGIDAARLEERAHGRKITVSGYAAHVLRAHLRANPPMPYKEFEELKRVVNELAAVRGALQQLIAQRAPRESVELSLRQTVLRLLPALKKIRDAVQDTLAANSKSWETPDA